VYLATYEPGEPKSSGRLWRIFPSKETLDLPDANAEALAKMAPEERGAVYFSQNCSSCHRVAGVGGTEGPDLTHASKELNKRLNGASYESMIKNMMASDDPYKTSQRPRFESVLKQKGKARLKAWLTNHLEEPRFDHPFAKMPSFSATLTPEKREDIMSYVISRE
jgi:mono/diheme cytochrome c family protein